MKVLQAMSLAHTLLMEGYRVLSHGLSATLAGTENRVSVVASRVPSSVIVVMC